MTEETTLADLVEQAARYVLCQPDWRGSLEPELINPVATLIRQQFVQEMEQDNGTLTVTG